MIPSYFSRMYMGAAALFVFGCASTQAPGTSPMDMSHAGHMAAAAEEQKTADSHMEKYDPNASVQEPDREVVFGDNVVTREGKFYNPTDRHKKISAQHQALAKQHAAAADELNGFKEQECAEVGEDIRHLCPFIGTVNRVERTKRGARLYFKEDVDVNQLYTHARCHHAFGAHGGYENMPDCPLYMKNVSMELDDDNSIVLSSKEDGAAEEILRRANALSLGSPASAVGS